MIHNDQLKCHNSQTHKQSATAVKGGHQALTTTLHCVTCALEATSADPAEDTTRNYHWLNLNLHLATFVDSFLLPPKFFGFLPSFKTKKILPFLCKVQAKYEEICFAHMHLRHVCVPKNKGKKGV